MNHFANNGKEYLKKKRQYRSNQGRSPEKTRLKANKENNSYRLDVIDKGEILQFYFVELKKAIEFQNKKIKNYENNK